MLSKANSTGAEPIAADLEAAQVRHCAQHRQAAALLFELQDLNVTAGRRW